LVISTLIVDEKPPVRPCEQHEARISRREKPVDGVQMGGLRSRATNRHPLMPYAQSGK